MVAARRVSTLSISGSTPAIDFSGILQHGLDFAPRVPLQPLKETALPAGMTGDAADLFDQEKYRVVVAVEADLAHALYVAGCLSLSPELLPRSRPVMRLSRRHGSLERLAIHPGEREHRARRDVLCDRRHEPFGVPVDGVEKGHFRCPIIPAPRSPPLSSPPSRRRW